MNSVIKYLKYRKYVIFYVPAHKGLKYSNVHY